MTEHEEQTPKSVAFYAKVIAHLLAWPLLIFLGPPTAVSTYLVIASGEHLFRDELAYDPFFNWWVVFAVAQVMGLVLVAATSGIRSRVLLAAADLTVFWVAMVALAAWIAVSNPHQG